MNRDAIIAKAAGAYDKVRPGLMPGSRFFLLKRVQHSSQFEVVFEITSGFWSRWNNYREQSLFQWADAAEVFVDRVAQTTHVGFGVPDNDDHVDIFTISADQRDRIAPSGANLIWKLYGIRDPKERLNFTVE